MPVVMKMETQGDTLHVVAGKELGAANANAFRDWVRKSLTNDLRNIEVDLSQTAFLDSCGLGALVALHKTVSGRHGQLRLLHPQPTVLQILELTRMNRLFEIVES